MILLDESLPGWSDAQAAAVVPLLCLLVIAFITDVSRMKIPNKLTAIGAGLGGVVHFVWEGWSGLGYACIGFAAGFGCMLVLYGMKAVGAGDVKLFGAIGALGGWETALSGAVYAILFAGGIAIVLWICRRNLKDRVRMAALALGYPALLSSVGENSAIGGSGTAKTQFPFMVAVLPAMAMVFWYGGL